MASTESPEGAVITEAELLETAKAVRDQVLSSVEKMLDKRLKAIEQSLVSVQKHLDKTAGDGEIKTKTLVESSEARVKALVDSRIDSVRDLIGAVGGQSGDAEAGADIAVRVTKMLENRFDKSVSRLDSQTKELAVRFASLVEDAERKAALREQTLTKSYEERLDQVSRGYEAGVEQLKSILDGFKIPAPQVVVNPQVSAPDVNVTVPQQPAPVVNVETKSPDVHVTVPPTPPREKTFEYDDSGRPLRVIEKDAKEGGE